MLKKPKILVVGSFMMDLIASTKRAPNSGETVVGLKFQTAPGGKGANQAVQCAREALAGFDGSVLVCYGDMPLMRRATYESLIETHKRDGNHCTLFFFKQKTAYELHR